jgi:DNA polymerase I-like protein with 3'-5' exonuclease and polymerase domains
MYRVDEQKNITACSPYDITDYLENLDYICLDVETEGLIFMKHRLTVIIVGDEENQFVIPINEDNRAMIKMVLCELEGKTVIGHYLLFDLPFIKYYYGCNVGAWKVFDTFQQECIFTKGDLKSDKSYKHLVSSYLNINIDKDLQTSFKYGEPLTPEQIMYCANDIKHLPELTRKQLLLREQFIQEGLGTNRLYNMENRLTAVLSHIQAHGINYDLELHNQNSKKTIDLMNRSRTTIFNYLKTMFVRYQFKDAVYSKDFELKVAADVRMINLESPAQLLTLFKRFDNSVLDTKATTIAKYIRQGENADLVKLMRYIENYKHTAKQVSTYGEKFASAVNFENGLYIIRTSIGQNLTTTGRLISSDVVTKEKGVATKNFANLQNIPKVGSYRECYIARPGYTMGTLDLAGCELRILASQSKDPVLIADVTGEGDLHRDMAKISHSIIQNNPNIVVTDEMRGKHKPVLFGLIYDAREARIAEILNVSRAVAKKIYKAQTDYLVGAFKYLNGFAAKSMKQGFATANEVTKRFYVLHAYTEYERQNLQYPDTPRIRRQMFNYPMQATNADMMKSILIAVFDYFNTIPEYDCRILMSVYDELVFEVPTDCIELVNKVKEIAIETANEFLSDGVTMKCNLKTGPHWMK